MHAGVITRGGGRVTLVPAPGESFYRGGTRNGVESGTWEEPWEASIRFEGAPASPPAVPVQAPVAHTLRTLGEVQLYIQFRTGSAELDSSAVLMLAELRDALRTDPGLRLALVGHTDNVGAVPSNRTLSHRRADAVRTWLASQGIEGARLRAEGRGQEQPVADNTSEVGRALNRRVQALRLN
jgi:outer membrane protein OmpA-like peptidoglycan-associated protein